jgi:hypothetical protein
MGDWKSGARKMAQVWREPETSEVFKTSEVWRSEDLAPSERKGDWESGNWGLGKKEEEFDIRDSILEIRAKEIEHG